MSDYEPTCAQCKLINRELSEIEKRMTACRFILYNTPDTSYRYRQAKQEHDRLDIQRDIVQKRLERHTCIVQPALL